MAEMLSTTSQLRTTDPVFGAPALVVWPPSRVEAVHVPAVDGGLGDGRRSALQRALVALGARRFLFLTDVGALVSPAVLVPGAALLPVLALTGVTLVLLAAGGLYRARLTLSLLDDAPQLIGRTLLSGALVAATAAALDVGAIAPAVAVAAAAGVLLTRGLTYSLVVHLRRRGWVRHGALILGAGDVGQRLVHALQSHRELGLRPVGLLDDDPGAAAHEQPIPLLGTTDGLAEAVKSTGAEVVIVAFGRRPESEMVSILRTCDRLECSMFFVPRLFEIGAYGDVDHAWDVPLIRLRRTALRRRAQLVKRSMDICLAGTALLLLSPLLLAVAGAVRLTNGSGVIFRQVRCGMDGDPFTLLKFRTLRDRDNERSQTQWSVQRSDAGPVGRFLRRTSIDELPQLWNVIRGQMSLVGPRPERPYFVHEFTQTHKHYTARHRMRAGLTGYAQAKGLRGNTSVADRLTFDNDYIENWSLWLDCKIMIWTLRSLLRASGS